MKLTTFHMQGYRDLPEDFNQHYRSLQVAGGSHFVHLEQPDEAVRAISEFVGAQTEPA